MAAVLARWGFVSDILPEEVKLQQDLDGDGVVGSDLTGKHFAVQMPDSTTANLYFLNNEAILGIHDGIWLDPYTANGFGPGSKMEIGYENPPTSITLISASTAELTRYDDGVTSVDNVTYTLSDFDPSGVLGYDAESNNRRGFFIRRDSHSLTSESSKSFQLQFCS